MGRTQGTLHGRGSRRRGDARSSQPARTLSIAVLLEDLGSGLKVPVKSVSIGYSLHVIASTHSSSNPKNASFSCIESLVNTIANQTVAVTVKRVKSSVNGVRDINVFQ